MVAGLHEGQLLHVGQAVGEPHVRQRLQVHAAVGQVVGEDQVLRVGTPAVQHGVQVVGDRQLGVVRVSHEVSAADRHGYKGTKVRDVHQGACDLMHPLADLWAEGQ